MRATCSSEIMLYLGKRIHPAPPATADLTNDPAKGDLSVCRKARIRHGSGLHRLRRGRRRQIHTERSRKGRLIRHAGAVALAVLALAVAVILTSPGGLLIATI